jgi:aminoglycoside phosphotransferase (APT) family kinase protein
MQIAVSAPRGEADSILEELPARLAREQRLPVGSLRIDRISVARGRSATCILSDGASARFVAKIPMNSRSLGRCEENLAVLRQIHSQPAIPEVFQRPIPQPVGQFDIDGLPVFVETAVPGIVEADRGRLRRQRARRGALRYLTELHAAAREQTPMDDALFEERIGHYCDRLGAAFQGIAEAKMLRSLKERLRVGLGGRSWPFVPEHGDFHLGNCLFEAGGARLTGVIDWDLGARPGLPVLDVMHFLVTSEGTGRLDGGTAARLLHGGMPAESRALLGGYMAALDIESASQPAWALLYVLVKLLVPAITREGQCRARWLQAVVVPTLRELEGAD